MVKCDSKNNINLKEVRNLPKTYLFFLIPTFIFAIGNMSYAFFILRAENLGLSVAFIPFVYLIYTITYATVAIPAGKLADKIGKIPTLAIGNLFFLIACILYMTPIPTYLIWTIFIFYGLFFAFNVGISKAYVTTIVPHRLHATALGIHNFIIGICALPASFLVGYLWDHISVQIAFGYSATLAGISTLLYITMMLGTKVRAR